MFIYFFHLKTAFFWHRTQCSLVGGYQLFRGVCCLHLDAPSEKIFTDSEGSPETMVHIYQTTPYVTSHRVFFIATADRTSNLTFFTFVPFASGQALVNVALNHWVSWIWGMQVSQKLCCKFTFSKPISLKIHLSSDLSLQLLRGLFLPEVTTQNKKLQHFHKTSQKTVQQY